MCVLQCKKSTGLFVSLKKEKKTIRIEMSLIPLPAFDDAIQGQAILEWIKAFSRATAGLK